MGKEVSKSTKVKIAIEEIAVKTGHGVVFADAFLNPDIFKAVISKGVLKILCVSFNVRQKQVEIVENRSIRFSGLNWLLSVLKSFGFREINIKSLH